MTLDKFVEKMVNLIANQASEEAAERGYDPKKISDLKIFLNNEKIEIDSKKKHFIFVEYVSFSAISEKISIVVYLDP